MSIQPDEQCGIEIVARTMLQNGTDHNTGMKITGMTEDNLAQIRH